MGGPSHSSRAWKTPWGQAAAALALAFLFLLPRLASPPAFPLHDVGFNLHVLEKLDAAPTPATWLEEASRLRPERFYPLYWGIQHVLWRLGGRSLVLFFWANLLLLALLLWGSGRLAARLGGRPWLAWVFLLASPGLLENTHTIMKQELPLACLEILAWSAFLSRRGITALALLALAGLLKETALFTGPALLIFVALQRFSSNKKLDLFPAAGGLLALGLGILALLSRRPGPYTGAFSLSPSGIAAALLFYLKREGVLFLFLPGALLLWAGGFSNLQRGRRGVLLGTLLLFLFWAGGYLPWRLPQVRYLLVAFAFLAPLSAAAWERRNAAGPFRRAGALIFLAGALISLPWAASREYREGRARLLADRAVSQAMSFARELPRDGTLRILLPEDEPLLEFRFRVHLLEGRPDLRVLPALSGYEPGKWVAGLKSLARKPPSGEPLLVPFAKGIPPFADRVFPVTEDWSAALHQAVRRILGFVGLPAGKLGAFQDAFKVGFEVLRFQAGPTLDLLPSGKFQLDKGTTFQVEGCLPDSMEKAPLRVVLETRPGSPAPRLSWNGKTYPPQRKGSGRFRYLLPADRPGPPDAQHRFLESQTLLLETPGPPVTILFLQLEK